MREERLRPFSFPYSVARLKSLVSREILVRRFVFAMRKCVYECVFNRVRFVSERGHRCAMGV